MVFLLHPLTSCAPVPEGESWSPGPGLKTRWAADVDPNHPLPEYPRPQMVRDRWQSLNGMWELATFPDSAGEPSSYPLRILVPFPVESALSGVMGTVTPMDRVWYRRTFSLATAGDEGGVSATAPTRWLLHFGAVDWDAEVFLNGRSLGAHTGGYAPFTFDITDALVEAEDQELVVAVRDPTSEGTQPRGKQVLDPHGIWYTAVTGIWQTVWLEPVPGSYIASLRLDPELEAGTLTLSVDVRGSGGSPEGSAGAPEVEAVALDQGNEVARASGPAGEPFTLTIPDPHPWSPSDPFLYDLRVELTGGDVVESYFGMRSISVRPDGEGRVRLLLNGEPLFQYGPLDQGWWPDGLYTAPTDEALRFDVAKTKELGFNVIRKHVKVEPDRWYHHADREGILVWQDMPSGRFEGEVAQAQYARELEEVVNALHNHPSIVMWVPFNEGWGQHQTPEYVSWLQEHDPTRLVNGASGWTDEGVGAVMDVHRYPGPGAPSPELVANRAPVLGEFGGLGLPVPGHTWVDEENWGYRTYENLEELNRAYADLLFQLRPLIAEGLAAAVYTQTTDVEVEVNGIMTYDREMVKLSDVSVALHAGLYGSQPSFTEVVPTSRHVAQDWRYTMEEPAEGWPDPDFDDGGWSRGPGAFGGRRPPGLAVGTAWEASDLWLRRSFRLTPAQLASLTPGSTYLRAFHDEDAEIYLNGVLVASLEGQVNGYRLFLLTSEALELLAEGTNTLAVHVHNEEGGQFMDAGIVVWEGGGP
jgi:hypothetical protein